MSTYLDTGVILTRYVPTDSRSQQVEAFFENSREARYVSEISVLELYSVFSRLVRADTLKPADTASNFQHLNPDEKVKVAVEHAIRTWRLKTFATDRSPLKLAVGRQTIEIGHELFEAIRLSSKFGLKTLDNLHLAYASAIREVEPDLSTFTTLDKEIISRRKEVERQTGIRIVEPLVES